MDSEHVRSEDVIRQETLGARESEREEISGNTRFTQHLIIIGILNLIISGKNFILLPLLTKNLSVSDFGIYDLFITSATMVPLVITLGLPYTTVRFLAAEKRKAKMRETFYTIFFVVFLISSLIGMIFFFIGLNISKVLDEGIIIFMLSLVILPDCLILVTLDFFRGKQMVKNYAFFKTFQIVILIFFTILAMNTPRRLVTAMFAVLISDLITFLCTFVLIIKKIGFQIPKFNHLREFLAFGFPLFISNFAYLIVTSYDRYVIAFLLGSTFVGYYSPAYTIGSIFSIFIAPFGFLLPAFLSKLYDLEKIEEVRKYLNYSLKIYLLIAIPSIFGITLLAKEILEILTTQEISQKSAILIPFIGLGVALWGIYIIISQILVITKKTSITGRIWITTALLNIIINPILIFHFDLIGAAITVLISYLFLASISLFISFNTFKFYLDFSFLVKSMIASVLMSFLIIFLQPVNIFHLVITIGLGGAFYLIFMVLIKGITKNDFIILKNSLGSFDR